MHVRVFSINDKKSLVPASYDAFLAEFDDARSYFWVDIAKPESGVLERLLALLDLHPLVLESCLDATTSARVMPFPHCLYVQLPLQTMGQAAGRIALSVICLPQTIITLHAQPVLILDTVLADFANSRHFHTQSIPAVLYQVLDLVFDAGMANAIELRQRIDDMSDAIDREADAVPIGEILTLKRHVAHLGTTLEEQHYAVTLLPPIELDFFPVTELREYFHDAIMHLEYALRLIARQESRLGELHQHYLLMLQEKTNNRLKILTILSAIFMPLTLIAGIYGMNFHFMPELRWPYAYPMVLGGMLFLAGVMLCFFYTRGWFK